MRDNPLTDFWRGAGHQRATHFGCSDQVPIIFILFFFFLLEINYKTLLSERRKFIKGKRRKRFKPFLIDPPLSLLTTSIRAN